MLRLALACVLWVASWVLLAGAIALAGVLLLVGDSQADSGSWFVCVAGILAGGVAGAVSRWLVD